MAKSSSSMMAAADRPALRWFLCCFLAIWAFLGAALVWANEGDWTGRRDSKLDVVGPGWGEGEDWGRDFPRFDRFDDIVRAEQGATIQRTSSSRDDS